MQTTKTSVIGAINMLGLAKRLKIRILQASTSEVYGDPSVHPQPETYWGNVNPIGPRSCYDEGRDAPRPCSSTTAGKIGLPIKVARIFNTYGPRTHPNDGRVVSSFIVQALRNRGRHPLWRRRADTLLLLRRRPHPRHRSRLMDTERRTSWARSTSATRTNSRCASSLSSLSELTGSRSKIIHRPLPQDDPRQRRPDISEARGCSAGDPVTPLKEGLRANHSPISRGSFRTATSRRRFAYDGAAVLVTGGAATSAPTPAKPSREQATTHHLRQPLDGARELRALGPPRQRGHPRSRHTARRHYRTRGDVSAALCRLRLRRRICHQPAEILRQQRCRDALAAARDARYRHRGDRVLELVRHLRRA